MRYAPVKLADLSELITKGTTPTTVGFDYTESGVPFLRVQNINGGKVRLDKEVLFISEQTNLALKRSRILPGDVLVSIAGTIGRAAVVPDHAPEMNCNQAVAIVRTNGRIFRPFLRHWLESPQAQSQMFGASVTATISNLSLTQVGNLSIPLPPFPEQKRIAAILDKADELRAKRRAALAELDTLVQSIFLEMFGDPVTNPKGWKTCKIGDLLESASYGTSEKSGESGQYPVLRMNNITRTGEIDLRDLKYMDLEDDQKERYLVRTGDVLFNRTNSAELVGKTAIFRGTQEMAYAGYLVRLRVSKENHPEYLSAFLNADYAKRVLRGMCKSIIGMANINAKEVQGINIHKVPLPLQQEFASRVAAVGQQKMSHSRSLSEFEELFVSLQHRAFRGEL